MLMEGQRRGHHGQKDFSRPTDPFIIGESRLLARPSCLECGACLSWLAVEVPVIVSMGSAETGLANPSPLPFLRAFVQCSMERFSRMAIFFIWLPLLDPDGALPVASG